MTNRAIPDYYQNLAGIALEHAPTEAKEVMLWAEIEPGVVEVALFYKVGVGGRVQAMSHLKAATKTAYEFWKAWQQEPGNKMWRGLALKVSGGRFSAEVIYPEEFQPVDVTGERRQKAVEEYFGTSEVDYLP